jgi:acyl carrier protein
MAYGEQSDGSTSNASDTRARIRRVLEEHSHLSIDVSSLADAGDLYEAGMTSRASVSVMLGLESEFAIEFPDTMLRRDVFESIEAIGAAVDQLVARQ